MADDERTQFLGEKTIARYGCFGCHTIAGFEKATPIGVELTEEGSKLVERLDFGFEEGKIAHTLPAWVHRKLMEPRVFDVGKVEAARRAAAHAQVPLHDRGGRRPRHRGHVPDQGADPPGRAEAALRRRAATWRRAGALVRNYNCQGCHQIGEKGGTFRAIVEDQLESSGGEAIQAQALSPADPLQRRSRRSARARACTPTGCTASWPSPSNKIRPWLAGAHADLRVHEDAAQHHHPLLRGPGRGALSLRAQARDRPGPARGGHATSSAAGSA